MIHSTGVGDDSICAHHFSHALAKIQFQPITKKQKNEKHIPALIAISLYISQRDVTKLFTRTSDIFCIKSVQFYHKFYQTFLRPVFIATNIKRQIEISNFIGL